MNFHEIVKLSVIESYSNHELSKAERDRLFAGLFKWFNGTRKKPVPDLDARLALWEAKIRKLADTVKFSFEEGRVTATAPGEANQTMNQLTFGTQWFQGHPDLVILMLYLVHEDQTRI